jgi:hypothetical protein
MAKRIAFKDKITVDATDLSNFARSVELSSEHERVDVSGFNPTGSNEYLAGTTEQSVTVEFYGSYGAGEVHSVLYPLHKNRTTCAFKWLPDGTAAISATNPELRGNCQVLTYSPGSTRGEADTYEVEFTASDPAGLAFFTT